MLKLKVLRFLYENNENRLTTSFVRTGSISIYSKQIKQYIHILDRTADQTPSIGPYSGDYVVYNSLPGTIYCGLQSTPLSLGPCTVDYSLNLSPWDHILGTM